MSPLQYLKHSCKVLLGGLVVAFKDKRGLLSIALVALAWLVLAVLPIVGINPLPVKLLNFLTFAQGGLGMGVLGTIGGIIGKTLWAYLLLPWFHGKKPLAGLSLGWQKLLITISGQTRSWRGLGLGAGCGLIAFNFLSGNASLQNSMVAIVALIFVLRALATPTGFLPGLLNAFVSSYAKPNSQLSVEQLLSGLAIGFALALPLTFSGISSIGYLSGLLSLVAAIIAKPKGRKEAIAR